jgi:hypothetical protein
MRPPSSMTKSRPVPSFGAAIPTGDERPRAIVANPIATWRGSIAGAGAGAGLGFGVGLGDFDGLFEGDGFGLGDLDFEGEGVGDADGETVGATTFVLWDVHAATAITRVTTTTNRRRGTTLMMGRPDGSAQGTKSTKR